jgi:type VI secretion system protein ImpK
MASSEDPFRPDVTGIRPRPGGGKRGHGDGSRARGAPLQTNVFETSAEAPPATVFEIAGSNPLVQAATPLLLLMTHLRETRQSLDVTALRRQVLDEIRGFEERARSAGVSNETVLAARYALCAGIDEAVLSTSWGHESEWAQHPLLIALHREAWGGEKFFDMLERMSHDPARHIDLLELQHLLIAFGFEGKYRVQERGAEHLAQVQHALYERIREYRGGATDRALSIRWRGLQDRRNPVVRYVPWWIVALAALPILALTFTAYSSSLADLAAPVKIRLAGIGFDAPAPAPAVPASGPTLRQLLEPDAQRGLLSVEEGGNQTTITLPGGDLFASGSATVNPAYRETLQHVTAALNRVSGSVRVIGHTDDQPIRSLRFQDNFDLSRERAVSVVTLLQDGIDNRARFQWVGVGSSQPRYRPESDPGNRARNRRVEIVHVRGT